MDDNRTDAPIEKEVPKFRGLYRYVRVSVKALDWIIVACIAVIIIVFLLNLGNLGFDVTFDSRGGTDVEVQTYMWGQRLEAPPPPTREGYSFTGWYKDYACNDKWDMEADKIETDLTLYAGWEETE